VRFNTGKLNAIKRESFKNASDLVFIEIFNTKIGEIKSMAFEGAINLREVSLRQCEVGRIDENAFVGLKNLEKIRLTGSKFDKKIFLNILSKSVTIEN
jgi:BspA type Leucine rich repeat region (6 copies)